VKVFRRRQVPADPPALAAPPARQRTPHPNPHTESKLLVIVELEDRLLDKRRQVAAYTAEIGELLKQSRELTEQGSSYPVYVDRWASFEAMIDGNTERVRDLQREIRQLEADIDAAHEAIIKHKADLDVNDLAYL
jgi:uncharacterized protein Yka (UPF0111/DUF47 family)